MFGVFLPIILPMYMGLDGLLWSFPVADILTFVIAAVIVKNVYKELGRKRNSDTYEDVEYMVIMNNMNMIK